MFQKLNIASRLVILILIGGTLVLGLVVGWGYYSARLLLEKETESRVMFMAQAAASQIEVVEKSAEMSVRGIGDIVKAYPPKSEEDLKHPLFQMLEGNSNIFGAAIAFSSDSLSKDIKYTVPYVFRLGETLVYENMAADKTDYTIQDWYSIPMELKKPVWSEPYYGKNGDHTLMVTYSLPIFAENETNKVIAIVTCDVSLQWLSDYLATLPVGGTGYAFLITRNGTFISHPDQSFILSENIFSQAQTKNDQNLRELGRSMIHGEKGFVPLTGLSNTGADLLTYVPIPSTGWSLGIVLPQAEVRAGVLKLANRELKVGFLGVALLLVIVFLIARSITRPLVQLEQATRLIAGGNLDAPIPIVPGSDEVARLASSFVVMNQELKTYMKELQETATARERIETELRVATSIQMSLVPKTFPAFPEREDLDLFAIMEAAREVGGDFYDFFMVDDDHLALIIGDVSGKGVPAALFMAVTRSFLRAFFREEKNPGAILTRLNDELSQDNDSCMFVTIFCSVVTLSTGDCRYANGGHNPPFLLRQSGEVEEMPSSQGIALGAMEGIEFGESSFSLQLGDSLFMYTDGVTEAMDKSGNLFSEKRTVQELEKLCGKTCGQLLEVMRQKLSDFAHNAEQSDDITMLAFRFQKGS